MDAHTKKKINTEWMPNNKKEINTEWMPNNKKEINTEWKVECSIKKKLQIIKLTCQMTVK